MRRELRPGKPEGERAMRPTDGPLWKRASLESKEVGYRGNHEKDRDYDRGVEKEFFGASALIECRREIVATEGSSDAGAPLLEHDAGY
jgi:hypothetical protein